MLSLKLQIILLLFASFGFILLLQMLKTYALRLQFSLLWLFLSLGVIFVAAFPASVYRISASLGFEKPVNVIFLMGITGATAIIFSLTVSLSRLSSQVRQVTQEVGLLRLELEERSERETL
jgi:hypothetical protein